MKHAQKDTQSSLSSSFKHFRGSETNPSERGAEPEEPTENRNVGTLDRNFFTRSNFSFDDSSSWDKGENATLDKRQRYRRINKNLDIKLIFPHFRQSNHDPEAMEAITNLDKVLY